MIDREMMHELLGVAGPDLFELARKWAENKIHVYQFVAEAEKIVAEVAQKATDAEREACAFAAEMTPSQFGENKRVAEAIRARGTGGEG